MLSIIMKRWVLFVEQQFKTLLDAIELDKSWVKRDLKNLETVGEYKQENIWLLASSADTTLNHHHSNRPWKK